MSNAREQIKQLADRLKAAAQGECECTGRPRLVTTDHSGDVRCDSCGLAIGEGAKIGGPYGVDPMEDES
jgi:hypothetical protein